MEDRQNKRNEISERDVTSNTKYWHIILYWKILSKKDNLNKWSIQSFVSCFTVLKVQKLNSTPPLCWVYLAPSCLSSKMCRTLTSADFTSLFSRQLGLHRSGPFSHLRLHTVKFRHQDTRSHPRVEVPLELQKLAHEVKIGGHHRTTAPHVFVGICHCHEGVLHKVGDDDGRRTGHACLAVHQHTPSTLICLLWGGKGKRQNGWIFTS